MNPADREREHARQQALLQALWRRAPEAALAPWLRPGALQQRGLQAYRANAGANAERALAAVFPTVQALVGEESFAALARACWHALPPDKGDMACFAQALPAFVDHDVQLADVPYLADVARLELLLAQAEAAPDAAAGAAEFELLAEAEPEALRFVLVPGAALLRSAWPVVSLWQAHRPGEGAGAHAQAARRALQAGEGEAAFVWRQGWKARLQAVDAPVAAWCDALLGGASIGSALQAAGAGFDFEAWLLQALPQGWVLGVRRV